MLKLTLRNLWAHPLRTLLTAASVMVAVFLLCILQAAVRGLSTTLERSSTQRLLVQSAVSLYVDLPLAYQSKIAAVPGVDWVCKWQWFGGVYQDESNFFAQFGIDPDTFLKSYPELAVVEGSYEEFQAKRTSCIIGVDLAEEYGWNVGSRIPILGKIFPRADGTPWEFDVAAIYRSTSPSIDQNTLYFHFDYLRESIEAGAVQGEPGVGVYMLKLAPGADATAVMAAVDLLFDKGPQRVQTTTEAEFNRQFVTMLGNVPLLLSSIGGAVLVAVFFAVLSTMLTAAGQRSRDVGIMKALGFTDAAMFRSLLMESLVLCGAGGLLGIGLAKLVEGPLAKLVSTRLPGFEISPGTLGLGIGLALLVGLIGGIAPGTQAARLLPVEALRREA